MTREEILQTAKPILFNTDMVQAILDGRKIVTRRLVKFRDGRNPNWTGYIKDGLMLYNGANEPCARPAPYKVGDYLYVRETWNEWTGGYTYRAWPKGLHQPGRSSEMGWRRSIHMPKEAARIFLKVTDVRVERLQDISDGDCKKEGINVIEAVHMGYVDGQEKFSEIWDSVIPKKDLDKYRWEANPWVWVIEFKRINPSM